MMNRWRLHRGHIAFVHDVAMAGLSFLLSLWLRLGDGFGTAWSAGNLWLATLLFTVVAALVFLSNRMYRGIWRYASTRDLMMIVRVVTMTIVIFVAVLFLVTRLGEVPRSVMLINWFALLAMLGGPRFLYRIVKDIPVLLVGAGDAADLFLRASFRGNSQYRAVGILSETTTRVGRGMHGVEVLGTLVQLEQVVNGLKARGLSPERLILTDERLQGAAVRTLLDQADALGLTMARLPKMTDLKSADSERLEVKPIAVEDLLGRPQTVLDRGAMRSLIEGRRVLVTGAGGSIGGELVRQIADCAPAALSLLELSEYALYSIDHELGETHPDLPRRALIADVRDQARIAQVMAEERPALVFHAAALKHVPMVEANPLEGVRTNAIGTRVVADACRRHAVRLMVLISTDKAVNPSSVMGATKRAAESYCQALDLGGEAGTRFVTVRFGNVLGSTGSVVPLFQRQLAAGGPITVTHPEMTRYFMTIREAVELVLQASALGFSHPDLYQGRIFVLDMGEPVKIVSLARQMIRLAGLRPEKDIKIQFTGLRPGEKLFEELFHGAEAPVPTQLEGVLLAAARAGNLAAIAGALDGLDEACRRLDLPEAMAALAMLVPEYQGDNSAPAVTTVS